MVKTLTQSVGGYYNFRQRYVKRSSRLAAYFKPSFWNIINVLSLNEKGKSLQQRLNMQVEAAQSSLKNLSNQPNDSTRNLPFPILGTNIILLAEWDALMRRNDLEAIAEELLNQSPDMFVEISDQIWDSLGDAWSAISDAVSDAGGSAGGSGTDGGSGCGSGCGGGCSS